MTLLLHSVLYHLLYHLVACNDTYILYFAVSLSVDASFALPESLPCTQDRFEQGDLVLMAENAISSLPPIHNAFVSTKKVIFASYCSRHSDIHP